MSRYERNTTVPDLDFLVRFARQYAVSLEWLIAGSGENDARSGAGERMVSSKMKTGTVETMSYAGEWFTGL